MDSERFKAMISHHWLPIAFLLVGVVLIVVGISSMFTSRGDNKSGVILEQAASTENTSSSSGVIKHIFVDVSGAVEHPGVYTLSDGARMQEALIAAGGLAANADREYISRSINLALKISDGTKIYIPAQGENSSNTTSSGTSSLGQSVSGAVNINSANLSELDQLPGIGQVTAQKIIDGRPYNDINELLTKKIVGQSEFDKIKEKISLY